jgi:hypothetical protein
VHSIVTFLFAMILKGQDGADREGCLTSSPLETLQYLDFSCIVSYIVSPENLQCLLHTAGKNYWILLQVFRYNRNTIC